jgi:hypothetical protein
VEARALERLVLLVLVGAAAAVAVVVAVGVAVVRVVRVGVRGLVVLRFAVLVVRLLVLAGAHLGVEGGARGRGFESGGSRL